MANPKLVLFNRMESATGKSVVGVDPTVVGTGGTFEAAKWSNGLKMDTDPANTLGFVNIPISNQKFTMEFWFKAGQSYASFAGGTKLFSWYDTGELGLGWDNQVEFNIYGDFGAAEPIYNFTNSVNFGVGDLVHFAFSFDNVGTAGSRVRAWQNNTELAVHSYSDANYPLTALTIYFKTAFSGSYTILGDLDNLKVWDGLKTDFTDSINNERSGMNDQVIIT